MKIILSSRITRATSEICDVLNKHKLNCYECLVVLKRLRKIIAGAVTSEIEQITNNGSEA